VFKDHTFKATRIARDIQVITGTRLAQAQERVVRGQLRRARYG
jgi:hypothetical protein